MTAALLQRCCSGVWGAGFGVLFSRVEGSVLRVQGSRYRAYVSGVVRSHYAGEGIEVISGT